jgi:hypothetical protein
MSSAQRHPSRRRLIAGGATLAAGALLPPVASAPVAALASDRDFLDLLFVLEQSQIVRYQALLERFDEAAFIAAGLPEGTRARIEAILAADQTHIGVLTPPVEPIQPAPVSPEMTDVRAALSDLAALEDLATAAYAGIIPLLERQKLIPELLGIHGTEARQAAWLATLMGNDPFPNAIDVALSPDETVARLSSVASGAPAAATPQAVSPELVPIVAAIAKDLGVSPDAVQIVSTERKTWPDRSLGCPKPGQMYAQVLTPGYLVVVEVNGTRSEFHTDERGNVVLCS